MGIGNTIVFLREESKVSIITFAERMSRFYMAIPVKDRIVKSMVVGLPEIKVIKSFIRDRFKVLYLIG